MKAIIYPFNNTIAVLSPSESIDLALKDIPSNVPYKIVNDTTFIDNDFFNAYEFDQELGAKINILKAKEIWKDKFRQARKPILEKLDVDYMRALETKNLQAQQDIITKKQNLRQVTDIRLPDTIEGIKNTWPNILNQ